MTVLSARALNRATLVRQFLLERAEVGVHSVYDAVAHLGGLQAQEPQEPFVGLWSRLAAFDPTVLDGLLSSRQVVRVHLMRHTVHLVTTDDLLAWRRWHDPMLRQRGRGVLGERGAGVDLDALAAAVAPLVTAEPRTVPDVARALGWSEVDRRALAHLMLSALPLVQVPPRGLWRVTAPARVTTCAAWTGREPSPPTEEALDAMVLRYLAAYGPAATADVRAWSGMAGLPAAVARVRERLVSFRDGRGRELLDLPDAPRPDEDTPAPVRFLPAFDNALLGYADRTRIVDDAHRGVSIAGERVVLVDGRVAATWTVRDGGVVVAPLRRFTRADRTAVAEEGRDLGTFLLGRPRVRVAASPR